MNKIPEGAAVVVMVDGKPMAEFADGRIEPLDINLDSLSEQELARAEKSYCKAAAEVSETNGETKQG